MKQTHAQIQALQGRHQVSFRITPLQGLNLRMYPFHRTLPDVIAKRLSALILVISCLFFIPKRLFKNFSITKIRRKAYNVNNPVCNAGLTSHLHSAQLRMELNYYVVPEDCAIVFTPCCVPYTGLFTFKTSGLVLNNKNLNNLLVFKIFFELFSFS